MTDTRAARTVFRIGAWTVDPSSGEVKRGETRHELQPRVMDVLEFLALHAQRVVSKEEILSAVWGDRFLTDGVLWRCVSRLRSVLEEDPNEPQVIQTLRGRGYRLVAEVEFEQCEPVDTKGRLLARWLVAAVFAAVMALAGWYLAAGTDTDGPVDSANTEAPAKDPQAAYRQGLALYQVGRAEENALAIRLLHQAVDLDSDFAAAHAALSEAYTRNWLSFPSTMADKRWLDAGLESAQRAVALDPVLPQAHKALGFALSNLHRQPEAIAAYGRALALDPDYAPVVQDLGAFFNSSGALDSALYWNLRVLELPDLAGLRWSQRLELSTTWILLQELSEARREVLVARKLAPDDPMPSAQLSEIELRLGRVVEARQVAASALNEHPRSVPLLGIAVSVEQVAGNLDSAMSLVERATSDPAARGNYDAWLRRASVARGLGQRKNSDAILASLEPAADKMIEMGLDKTSNRVRQAAIHAIRGEIDRALARLSEAVSDGYLDGNWLELDPIFAGLRNEREFQLLILEIEARVNELRRKATEAGLLPLSAPNLLPDALPEALPGAPGATA